MSADRMDDLGLSSPWINAPGSLGFAPPTAWSWDEPQGGFITNPVSWKPRTPAEEGGLLLYAGGFLLHTGWPNPGFRQVVNLYARRWSSAGIQVWVHLLAEHPDEVGQMVEALEEVEGVAAVELGLPPRAGAEERLALVRAAQGELPLVVCLPLEAVCEPWLARLPGLGVSALHLSAPRGCLPRPEGGLSAGRLYGPALLPQVMEAVRRLKFLGLPLIAGCGVFRKEDGQALLAAGARAVALDAVLWQINIPAKS